MKTHATRILTLLLVTVMLFCACSCSLLQREKTFTAAGVSISLTSLFRSYTEQEMEEYAPGFAFCYASPMSQIAGTRYTVSELTVLGVTEETTPLEFAQIMLDFNTNEYARSVVPEEYDGLVRAVSHIPKDENDEDSAPMLYCEFIYKHDGAFWVINFACAERNGEAQLPKFAEWAKTVTFSDPDENVS